MPHGLLHARDLRMEACTPMFDYPTHLTKAQCELAAKGLKEASCVPENNLLIAKKRDH
jgi:hypothetical protein